MKATALLEKQHRKVEGLFESLEGAAAGGEKLVHELATDLAAHAAIEEELFYPAAARFEKNRILESKEEHELMAFALRRLVAADPHGDSFQARLKACKDTVLHHVKEEEQELFPRVAEALGEEDETLGKQMEARFKELSREGFEAIAAARKARRTAASDGQRTRKATATTSKKKAGQTAHKAA